MSRLRSTVDILKLLDKTNCGACGKKTCMAFAASVFNNQATLDQCPHLAPEVIQRFSGQVETRKPIGEDVAQQLAEQKEQLKSVDLKSAAERLGVRYDGRRLAVPVLGKEVFIDENGELSANIHLNSWVVAPLLQLVLHGAGHPVRGEWLQFRDLAGGAERLGLFEQRAVKPLQRVADTYDDLFKDMLEVFSGDRDYNQFGSDISIILHPMPRVPLLVCYWKPSDGMGSDLNLFFDATASENIGVDALFSISAGLAYMFEKFARTHGGTV